MILKHFYLKSVSVSSRTADQKWICPLFYRFSCQYLLISYPGYCCIFQWVPETLKLNMLWFICTNARWTYEVQSQIDFTFFYLHFFFRIMTNGSLPRDKKPTKENTDNSSMAGFVKNHPEILNTGSPPLTWFSNNTVF